VTYLDLFEGDDCRGEVSGERYAVLRFRLVIGGVSKATLSVAMSAKLTVLRGVVAFALAFLDLLRADRVISCNWRCDLPKHRAPEAGCFEFRGVKNRVNRFGVIGGGFLGFRLPIVDGNGGGDEGGNSDIESSSRSSKEYAGDDIVSVFSSSLSQER
jgi:hypothetical protein